MPAAIAVMNKAALIGWTAGIKRLLKCIRCPAGDCVAICREGRTKSVLADRDAFQPTMRLAKVSITNAT